jgi:hypothetical protein
VSKHLLPNSTLQETRHASYAAGFGQVKSLLFCDKQDKVSPPLPTCHAQKQQSPR